MITNLITFDETNSKHLAALNTFNLSGHPLCSINDEIDEFDILLRQHIQQTFNLDPNFIEYANGSTHQFIRRIKDTTEYQVYFYADSENNTSSNDDEFIFTISGTLLINEINQVILQISTIIPHD